MTTQFLNYINPQYEATIQLLKSPEEQNKINMRLQNMHPLNMIGVRWYRSYDDLLLTHDHPDHTDNIDDQELHIAREINERGAKEFGYFANYERLESYKSKYPDHSLHEIINFNGRRNKMYFDIDCKLSYLEESKFTIEDFDKLIVDKIKVMVSFKSKHKISPDVILCKTNHPDKYSAHLIFNDVYCTREQNIYMAKSFNHILNQYINKCNPVDIQAYKNRAQSLRIAGCSKLKNNNIKELPEPYGLYHSLISLVEYCPCCDDSKYILNGQCYYGCNNCTYEIKEYFTAQVEDVKPITRKTIREDSKILINADSDALDNILNHLDSKRVENRQDWFNVCNALATLGESARESLHKWASKSKKYGSGTETNNLFNKADGRITFGTVLHMLKNDAPDEYNELIAALNFTTVNDESKESKESIKPPTIHEKLIHYLSNESNTQMQEYNNKRISNLIYKLIKHNYINPKICKMEMIDTIGRYIELNPEQMHDCKNAMESGCTIGMMAAMGRGKTELLTKFFDNNQKILFITFRRSLATDINNRLSKYGFVDYRSIDGEINDRYNRVICQLESLHRITWHDSPDLLIIDECESLFTQLEAKTVRNKRTVWMILNALLKESKNCIYMDANLSELSMEHIYSIRGNLLDHTHLLITNSYKPENKPKHYITTDHKDYYDKLINDINQNKNIVMCSNFSHNRLVSIRKTIMEDTKLEDGDILLITSRTQTDELVSKCLDDVNNPTFGFGRYRMVIYSPTIQAGVSYTGKHFDLCYGYFLNSSCDVNATTQMIKRVRHLNDNEYNYYYKQVGGATWSENKFEFEKSLLRRNIDTDTDIDISSNSLIERTFSFSKGYQYNTNDPYYKFYVNYMTRKARDKNNFLYLFMRTMLASGEFDKFELLTHNNKDNQNFNIDSRIKEITGELKLQYIADISSAPVIDEFTYKKFEAKKNKEKLKDDENYMMKKYEYAANFDIDINKINFDTVAALYHKQSQFKNIRQIYAYDDINTGLAELKKIAENERATFEDDAMADIRKDNSYKRHYASHRILKQLGFNDILDTREFSKSQLWNNIKNNPDVWKNIIEYSCDIFNKEKRRRPIVDKLVKDSKQGFRAMMAFNNSILESMYDVKIKETTRHSGYYKIYKSDVFRYAATDAEYVDGQYKPLAILKTPKPIQKKEVKQIKKVEPVEDELFSDSDSDDEKKYVDNSDSEE